MVFANFQAQIKNNVGDDVANPTITVRKELPGLPLATVFSDNAGTPRTNPFVADDDGYFRFYAEGGFYRITATSGPFSRTWFDVAIGNYAGMDVQPEPELITRIRLTGDTTFTVGTTGDFETMQEAWNHLCMNIDMAGFDVTFQLQDQTHLGGLDDHSPGDDSISFQLDGVKPVGGGVVKIVGNLITPTNVVVDCSIFGFRLAHSHVEIYGMRIHDPDGLGIGVIAAWQGQVLLGNGIVFGDADQHIHASSGGRVIIGEGVTGYTINGDATFHWFCDAVGHLRITDTTITLSGTPAFSGAFAICDANSVIQCENLVFSGGATGIRFVALSGGSINTGGTNNLNYLPGNAAGQIFSGGQYDDFVGIIPDVIASGSFPAAAVLDIEIPEGTRQLFINVTGQSSGTASRYPIIQVSTDGGSTFINTGYVCSGISGVPGALIDLTAIVSMFTAVAAARTWTYNAVINGLAGGGLSSIFSGITDDLSAGPAVGMGFNGGITGRITHIRFAQNGSGNFDAGTYSIRRLGQGS